MNKKEIIGWSIYDLANTAFSALFVTFFFPIFIKFFLGGNEFHIGLVFGVSMFLAGILVPFIGAISDNTGRRMPFLIFFTLACIILTAFVAFSNLLWAVIFGLLANLMYHAALDIYDAKLVDISEKHNMGKISAYGVMAGYLGGTILSLSIAYIVLSQLGWETKIGTQAMFLVAAIFYFIFSSITFILLKDKVKKSAKVTRKVISKAWNDIKTTFKSVRKQKDLWTFLIASFLYVDGMNTAIIFLFLFGNKVIINPFTEAFLSVQDFFWVLALFAVGGAIGAYIGGKISDKAGPRNTLIGILITWVLVIIAFIMITVLKLTDLQGFIYFLIAGSIGAAALGAVWTVTRPMLVKLAPQKNIAQFFGFQGLTEKFSGILGPPLFGFLVVISEGEYTFALASLLVFFGLGLILLFKIPRD